MSRLDLDVILLQRLDVISIILILINFLCRKNEEMLISKSGTFPLKYIGINIYKSILLNKHYKNAAKEMEKYFDADKEPY
jgi:hypothetical protein